MKTNWAIRTLEYTHESKKKKKKREREEGKRHRQAADEAKKESETMS